MRIVPDEASSDRRHGVFFRPLELACRQHVASALIESRLPTVDVCHITESRLASLNCCLLSTEGQSVSLDTVIGCHSSECTQFRRRPNKQINRIRRNPFRSALPSRSVLLSGCREVGEKGIFGGWSRFQKQKNPTTCTNR